jgi:transcriptional regulator with XRE-family HTH domain
MEIGNRVRELRQVRGLTQRELGRRAGLSHGAVSHLELGIRMPAAATVEKIARALGVEPGELYRGPVPLAEAPESGFPDVLGMSEDELEELRERARDDDAAFAALRDAQAAALENLRVARDADQPAEDIADVEARDRILRKLWKVVLFERIRPTVNADTRRKPEAPIYEDTTSLSLDDAYDVWRNARVPVGVR